MSSSQTALGKFCNARKVIEAAKKSTMLCISGILHISHLCIYTVFCTQAGAAQPLQPPWDGWTIYVMKLGRCLVIERYEMEMGK